MPHIPTAADPKVVAELLRMLHKIVGNRDDDDY